MEMLSNFVSFMMSHFQDILSSVIGILTLVIGIALMIPGDQPEKALQSVVDFLKRFSKK